jgi:hypothetical protein
VVLLLSSQFSPLLSSTDPSPQNDVAPATEAHVALQTVQLV